VGEGDAVSMVSQQFAAVFSAFIPFFLTLVAVTIAIWRVFEWGYRRVLEKRRELYEIARAEVELVKNQLEQTTERIKRLTEELTKAKNLSADEATRQLEAISASASNLSVQLRALGQANSSASISPGILSPVLGPGRSSPDWYPPAHFPEQQRGKGKGGQGPS
jgi:C4-dicarboxylate-specific signal transduction histidine kinase